jgi:hypothetical protein
VERRPLDLGDLVEHWTLVGAERGLVTAKQYDSQLGFGLLLKFYGRFGRFPRGRSELHDDAVEFVARQLGVGAGSVGFYEWSGRTAIRHRAEIRAHFGFRECTVADADDLAGWLAAGYAQEACRTACSPTSSRRWWPHGGPARRWSPRRTCATRAATRT